MNHEEISCYIGCCIHRIRPPLEVDEAAADKTHPSPRGLTGLGIYSAGRRMTSLS